MKAIKTAIKASLKRFSKSRRTSEEAYQVFAKPDLFDQCPTTARLSDDDGVRLALVLLTGVVNGGQAALEVGKEAAWTLPLNAAQGDSILPFRRRDWS